MRLVGALRVHGPATATQLAPRGARRFSVQLQAFVTQALRMLLGGRHERSRTSFGQKPLRHARHVIDLAGTVLRRLS